MGGEGGHQFSESDTHKFSKNNVGWLRGEDKEVTFRQAEADADRAGMSCSLGDRLSEPLLEATRCALHKARHLLYQVRVKGKAVTVDSVGPKDGVVGILNFKIE